MFDKPQIETLLSEVTNDHLNKMDAHELASFASAILALGKFINNPISDFENMFVEWIEIDRTTTGGTERILFKPTDRYRNAFITTCA